MKNFITRAITGVLFVAIVVTCFLKGTSMILLFALVTGMTIWEFTGLVNNRENVKTNRFISTVAGVYFFLSVAGYCSGMTPSAVFIPYLITIVYLFVSELYTKNEDAINDGLHDALANVHRPTLLMPQCLGFQRNYRRRSEFQYAPSSEHLRIPLDQ